MHLAQPWSRAHLFEKIRETLWPASLRGTDLRFRAARSGYAAVFSDASEFLCCRRTAYGNYRHLPLDDPGGAGRAGYVGTMISGIEMKIGENDEIVVRGPHIFPGYWNRSGRILRVSCKTDGSTPEIPGRSKRSWNWRISGRIKNLIILNSGHQHYARIHRRKKSGGFFRRPSRSSR